MGGGACISIHALGPKDQLLVTTLTGKQTIDGPGIKFLPPLKVGRVRRMDILEPGEYCIVKTTTTGALRRIDGPNQVNLGPYIFALMHSRSIGPNMQRIRHPPTL